MHNYDYKDGFIAGKNTRFISCLINYEDNLITIAKNIDNNDCEYKLSSDIRKLD